MLFPIKSALAKLSIEKVRFDPIQKHESIRNYITLSNMSKHLDLNTVFQYTDKNFLNEMLNNQEYSDFLHPLIERRQDLNYWKSKVKTNLKNEKDAITRLSKAINVLKSDTVIGHQRVKLLSEFKPKLSRISSQIEQQLDSLENPEQLQNLYLNHTTSIQKLNDSLISVEQFFDSKDSSNHIERLKSYIFSSLN